MSICRQQNESYFDFRENLWLMVLVCSAGEIRRKENIIHCLSLIFQPNTLYRFERFLTGTQPPEMSISSPCICQVGMVPQTAQNLLLTILPVASLVNIFSDFFYITVLLPCTNRKSRWIFLRCTEITAVTVIALSLTLPYFYPWHRKCDGDNHNL